MDFKIRMFLVIVCTIIFQYIIGFHLGLHLNDPLWWVVSIAYAFIQPFWQNPLAAWLDFQISLYHETKERRRKYLEYQERVKAGSVPVKDFETEAKRIIK